MDASFKENCVRDLTRREKNGQSTWLVKHRKIITETCDVVSLTVGDLSENHHHHSWFHHNTFYHWFNGRLGFSFNLSYLINPDAII